MNSLNYLVVLVLALAGPVALAVTITQAEYYLNTDPGIGLATAIPITADETVSISGLQVPTTGLNANQLHRAFLRYHSSEGVWSPASGRYFFILAPSSGTVDTVKVSRLEYWFDNLAATPVELTDLALVNYAALIPETLPAGLHTFGLRYQDDDGRWSSPASRYFFIQAPASGSVDIKLITQLEYWFDAEAPATVDLADASTVSFVNLIPQNLSNGIHTLSIRYRDDDGINSFTETRRFVIISQTTPNYQPGTIVAAEFFINGNPVQGAGVPIPLPTDGAWDEGEESTVAVVTNLPVGYHLFCVRYQSSFGTWTSAYCDSVKVTPILVIRRSGGDILLTWDADPLDIPFHIYRAPTSNGVYSDIAQTNNLNYTDTGVLSLPTDRNFYYVTTTPGVLSSFRLPVPPSENPVTK